MPSNPIGDFNGLDPDYDRGPIVIQWKDLGTGAAAKVVAVYESRQFLWNPSTMTWERATVDGAGVGGEITVFDYDGSGNIIYEGHASPGQAKSAATWQIKKFVYTGSNITDILWADGNTNFDNVWNNRTGLSYS